MRTVRLRTGPIRTDPRGGASWARSADAVFRGRARQSVSRRSTVARVSLRVLRYACLAIARPRLRARQQGTCAPRSMRVTIVPIE